MYSDRVWQGKWIFAGDCPALSAPVFRKTFQMDACKSAQVFVSGVGFYELFINGQRVGDHLLAPAFTAYDKTVLYNEYDVSALLKEGENTAEIILGNGWFNELLPTAWAYEHATWRGNPQFILDLVADGRTVLCSDRSWQGFVSKTRFNTLRYGETCDAGAEEIPCAEINCSRGPGGYLKKQFIPPIRLRSTHEPAHITALPSGTVYDFGVNLSGNAEICVRGKRGAKVTLLFTELVHEDGSCNPENNNMYANGDRFQQDEYILAGDGVERWHSRFCYHGFRYVQVSGDAEVLSVTARCFHTNLAGAGGIETDFEPVQKLHDACVRSTLTNFHHIPTDCPHREKNGWTGDAHASAEQALFNLDMKLAYQKFMDDLVDGQRPNGAISCISPTSIWGYLWGTGPTWDAVLFELPWQVYRYTGDTDFLRRYQPAQKKYLSMLQDTTDDAIYRDGLGDWCAPDRMTTCSAPMLLTAYAYYIHRTYAKICGILALDEEQQFAQSRAEEIKTAFRQTFIGTEPDSQTYLATLLYFNLTDDADNTVKSLLAEIEKADGHMFCGIFGAKFLLNVLTEHGHFDTAWKIATQEGYPGYLDMLSRTSGTLAEDWGADNSQNHHMYSEIGAWFYKALAGIRIDEDGAGFSHITLQPHIPAEIHHFKAWHETPLGHLEVRWDEQHVHITLPKGCTAQLISREEKCTITESCTLSRTEFEYV